MFSGPETVYRDTPVNAAIDAGPSTADILLISSLAALFATTVVGYLFWYAKNWSNRN